VTSVREIDNNDDVYVGVGFPLSYGVNGFFNKTKTILEQARSNVRNVLLTAKGERPMQPDLGSNLRNIIFDQVGNVEESIEEEIREVIGTQLPYIIINNVFVLQENASTNIINVQLEFSVSLDPETLDTITFTFNTGE
tara:strand:+ start:105 stop:518 length:414 start_codon:yes stop_codon:yes gene_type:complete